MSNNQTCVDMFNFKESASGANVDIITIEDGQQENNLDYRNRSFNRNSSSNRNTSPFRDRVQERYNRSLSPTLSPRLKRSPVPRSVSPGRGRSKPLTPRTPRSVASSPLKSSPAKSYNFGLNNSLTNESTDEEVRRLRFENLILQSKVDTLEAENKSLKEMSAKPVPVFSTDNKILSRQITQLNQDLNAATRKIDKLKKDNDDLTSQLYSLKVDRLEKPKRPEDLQKDGREDWTGCQADAIEHLCSENQRLRETIFDMNEQKLHVHKLLEEGTQGKQPRKRLDSCQLENEQLSEEKKRLLARLETVAEEASKSGEKFSKMKEDYASALSQILSLQAQLMKYEEDGSNKAGMENNTIRNLSEKCAELQDKMEQKEADFEKQMKEKEQEMQDQVDYHVKKLQDIEREVKRVSNVCELLCQEKDNAIQTLQKQIDTNAILSRSNEQLQNTVTEQSDRIRDLVYRQMRDTEVINELKNDFEYVLRERNELDNRVKHDKQVHLQRLASLKEQIHIARLSFAVLVEMLQDDTSLDTEKREELLRQLAEIDSQLGALQREILDIERMEAENIQVEMDEITVQFLKKSEQCEALQTQLSAVELDKSRLSKKHVDLETSLNDTKTSVDNFEAKCDELRQALHKKQIENDTMKAQLDKVKMKLGIMEGDKDTVEAKSRDLKAKNEELCDNAVELDVGLKETKKKLHQKESLSLILNQQMDEWEDRTKHLSNQISQLQKGLSRGTIQIGLLNEDLRVALSALFALNANVDSGEMEENLEILEDVSQQLEELEVALERTMGNVPGLLDLPLRGSSGEKISQLLQELDFYKENSPQVQNVEKGKKDHGVMKAAAEQQTAFKRLQHQLECSYQERLHLNSRINLLSEQCQMFKDTLQEKEKQLADGEEMLLNVQHQFEPMTAPSKTRHKPIYPVTMSAENMRSIISERDDLIRTLKSELKRCSAQTKAVINQNIHCNDVINTHKDLITGLQKCLGDAEDQYALLLASYKSSCGERVRQLYDNKCEQTETDHLFQALCGNGDTNETSREQHSESERLKKVVKALKKALDDEVEKRKNSSIDYDNLKSDIKKLAVKLQSDGQLHIPTADADIQAGVSQRDGICQTYLPGQTPSKKPVLSKAKTTSGNEAQVQTEELDEIEEVPSTAPEETEIEATPEELGDPVTLWRAKRQAQNSLKKLMKENMKLKDALQSANDDNKQVREKVRMLLQGDASVVAVELEKTLNSNAESRKVITDLLNDKENLSEKIVSDLQPKISSLNTEIEQYKSQVSTLKYQCETLEADKKKLAEELLGFKPEMPGSTTDGDVIKENIRLQTKVHNLYQETLKLKFKNKAAKESAGLGASSMTEDCTAKERISTLEEMSEKIENSLSTSYNREDIEALKEQVLDLQNALQDALDTIKDYDEGIKGIPTAAIPPPPGESAQPAEEESEGRNSLKDQESRTTQTDVPAGPTRVQLLVKIAIIGTKLTHRTKQIESLETSVKDKERFVAEKVEEIKEKGDKMAEMEEKLKIKEDELVENRSEIATFQEKMDEIEKTLASKQKEIEDLVFQAEEEASKTASAGANLEDLAAWKSKYSEVKAQKKKLQGAINFANKTLEEYKVNIDMLTGKVVQSDEDMNTFFATISDALKNDTICCSKNFGYISEKDKLQSAKNIILKFIEFTGQYSTKQDELTKESKATKEKLTTASDKADDLFKKLENVSGDLERTKNILETSQLELSQKCTELGKSKSEYDKLLLENDNLNSSHLLLQTENNKNKALMNKFEEEVGNLNLKLEEANQALVHKDKTLAEKDKTLAELDKTLAEKEQSLVEKEKDFEEAKSQLKTFSEGAAKEEDEVVDEEPKPISLAPPPDVEAEKSEEEIIEEGKEPSLKSASKSSSKSKQESIKIPSIKILSVKDQKEAVEDKNIINKLYNIEKEVSELNKELLKTRTALANLMETEEEHPDDDAKKSDCYHNLEKLIDRLANKNRELMQLCSENGVKSRPRKTRGVQSKCTIPPSFNVALPGEIYDVVSDEESSTDTLSAVSDITDKSTPINGSHLASRVKELEEIITIKELEINELNENIERMEALRKMSPSPPPSEPVPDDPESHDISYWKEKATRNEAYKKRCTALEKDLRLSTQELSNLRKQMIKAKSREHSVKGDLDDQLNVLQKQLEADRLKQKEIQEGIKTCQYEQKQDQEQLNQSLLSKIGSKELAVEQLIDKIRVKKGLVVENLKERTDIKTEIEKTITESAQTYADLESKFQTQVSQRDEEILNIKSLLRDTDKTKTDVQRELDDKVLTVERLEHKVKLLEQDLNDGSQTYKAFKQEIYELKDIIDERRKREKGLENELHTLKNSVQKNKDNAELAIKRMREAELARHEISEKSLEKQRALEEASKAKEKYFKGSAAKVKAMEAQVEALKNVLVKKHDFEANDNKVLELDIDPEVAKTMNNEDLMQQIKKLNEQLLATDRKRIDLKVDFKAALCELEALNNLLEEKESDRDKLVKLVAQLRKELSNFQADESTQSVKSDPSQYQFYTDEEYSDLQDELRKMAEELRAADEQKKSMFKERKQEKCQFDRMKSELTRRIEEYACLLAVHNKLENSIANLEDQCLQKGLEAEQYRVEIFSLKDSLAEVQRNAEKVDEQCRTKNCDIENMRSELMECSNEMRSLNNDIERLQNEHDTEKSIWTRSLQDMENDRNNLLKKIESISTAAMSQGSQRNSNVDHAKRFVNILKDLNQERVTSASATQRLEHTAQQNEITDLRRKLELTDNKRAHLVHELKRCECELQEIRDKCDLKNEKNKNFVGQMTSLNSKLAKSERKLQDAVTTMKHERQCGELLLEENRHLYADKEKFELTVEELNSSLKILLSDAEVSNSKVNILSEKLTHCEHLVKNLHKVNKLKTGDNFELAELNAHLIEKLHAHEPVEVISEELNELRDQIQPDRGLTEMMYEIEILQNEKAKLENEINLIKCKEADLIKAEQNKQELKFAGLKNKMKIIQANNDGTKEFIVNLNAENNELKNKLYDMQYQVEETEDNISSKEKEIVDLKSRFNKSLNCKPKSPELDHKSLQRVEDLKNELSTIKQTLKSVEKEKEDLEDAFSRQDQEHCNAIEQTKYYEQVINELNAEIGNHERIAVENQRGTQKCSSELHSIQQQLTAITEESWELTDRLRESTESNANKEVINAELKKKCEMLDNKLSVLSLEHNTLMSEMEEVAGELDKVSEVGTRRAELDETVKEVIEQNERMSAENSRLEGEMRSKDEAYRSLKRTQSTDTDLKRQIKLLKEENEAIQSEFVNVEDSCKKLSQENSRLSEAGAALQMASARVKDLKDTNEQLKKALKKELARDEARYLTSSCIDRIIKKLNDNIPEEINRLQALLSSKELDIQRLEVEVSSLHGELVEADRLLICYDLKNSTPSRVDNRDLYDAMKDAAVASRKVKVLENQLEDCKCTLQEVFEENKKLASILKETEQVQEDLSILHTPPSAVSSAQVTPEKELDLHHRVLELQDQLEETHEELSRTKNFLSKQDPNGKFVCARCKHLISSLYDVDEGELHEMVDKKDKEIVKTEQQISQLKKDITGLEQKMRNTHHGPGSSMVSLSRETYALKRKLRQNESKLKELWKEREECCKQLRVVDPHRLSTPQSKFSKTDVMKELKWKLEGGSPPSDVKALKKENDELREHILEITEFVCDQKWHEDLNFLRNENSDLKQQLQEITEYLDEQVSPDNDAKAAVNKAVESLQSELQAVYNYHKDLKIQLANCCEECDQFSKYRSNAPRDALKKHNSNLRNILKSVEQFTFSSVESGEKELKIYILRSGEVKVKCEGVKDSAVQVSQVQGCPEDHSEREQWCKDLEHAVQIISDRKSEFSPLRTSSPIRSSSTSPRGKSHHTSPPLERSNISSSSFAEERVLLKLVLQLPSSLNCSIELD